MIKSLSFKKGVCEQLAKGEGRRGEESPIKKKTYRAVAIQQILEAL